MALRDLIACVLAAVAAVCAFAGSWLNWGLGTACCVLAALLVVYSLLFGWGSTDAAPESATQPEQGVVAGERPVRARVRRSALGILPTREEASG